MTPGSTDDRLLQLETSVAHLQHDLDQLNQTLLAQHSEIRAIKQALQRLDDELQRSEEQPETRDLLQERPPHY